MSFRVDATPYVKFGQANLIAVQADTRRHGTRWYPGAGIYRKVTMTLCDPVHVAHWGLDVTTPKVSDTSATVRLRSTINSHLDVDAQVTVEVVVLDPDGQVVARGKRDVTVPAGGAHTVDQSLDVKNPQRWDIDSPSRYTAKTVVSRGDRVADTTATRFGIVDLCGIPKDRFYLYRSHWRPEVTTVHILPHWNWPDRVGKNVPVYVYTNGDSAELFLNGRSLGRRAKGQERRRAVHFAPGAPATASSIKVESPYYAVTDRYRLRWLDVPYAPGELKAVAYKEGEQIGHGGIAGGEETVPWNATQFDLDLAQGGTIALDLNGTGLREGAQSLLNEDAWWITWLIFQGGDTSGADRITTTFDNIRFTGGTTVLLGDVNLDGVVNGLDVDPFVGLVTGGTYQAEGDMNADGVVNGLDVEPFVAVVVGGDAVAVPEPSMLFLALVALGGFCALRCRQ